MWQGPIFRLVRLCPAVYGVAVPNTCRSPEAPTARGYRASASTGGGPSTISTWWHWLFSASSSQRGMTLTNKVAGAEKDLDAVRCRVAVRGREPVRPAGQVDQGHWRPSAALGQRLASLVAHEPALRGVPRCLPRSTSPAACRPLVGSSSTTPTRRCASKARCRWPSPASGPVLRGPAHTRRSSVRPASSLLGTPPGGR